MPGSCHHHHGNVSVLPVAITMAMGVSPSNHQHGPNVSLLTKIAMAICACQNTGLWYVCGYVADLERRKKKLQEFYHKALMMISFAFPLSFLIILPLVVVFRISLHHCSGWAT